MYRDPAKQTKWLTKSARTLPTGLRSDQLSLSLSVVYIHLITNCLWWRSILYIPDLGKKGNNHFSISCHPRSLTRFICYCDCNNLFLISDKKKIESSHICLVAWTPSSSVTRRHRLLSFSPVIFGPSASVPAAGGSVAVCNCIRYWLPCPPLLLTGSIIDMRERSQPLSDTDQTLPASDTTVTEN